MKYLLPFISFFLLSQICKSQSAQYEFTNGSALDLSGNNNHGTFYGNASVNNELQIGYNLDDYFTVPPAALNNAGAFAVTMKVKFNQFNLQGASATNHLISGDDNQTINQFMFAYQKSMDYWAFYLNGTPCLFVDTLITTDTWYCITLTRSQTGLVKLYKEGSPYQENYTVLGAVDLNSIIIGQETDCFADCFSLNQTGRCAIDDLKFYNSAIDTADIYKDCPRVADIQEDDYFNQLIIPNPIDENIVLLNTDHIRSLKIYNVNGALLFQTDLNSTSFNLNINHYSSGFYFLTLSNEFQTKTIKIFKR